MSGTGLRTSRFQSSSRAFEHGRLRRPGKCLQLLGVVPSRREGTTRSNCKQGSCRGKASGEEVTRFWNELAQADREQRLFGYVGFVVGGRKP